MQQVITITEFDDYELETNTEYFDHEIDLGEAGYHNISVYTEYVMECVQPQSAEIKLDTIAEAIDNGGHLKELLWEIITLTGADAVIDCLVELEGKEEAA